MRCRLLCLWVGTALLGSACLGPPRPFSPLAEAAGRNDVAAMKAMLAAAPLTRADDPHGLLIWAARNGAADAIVFLASLGVDVNELDGGGNRWTPLQHAVHKEQSAAVRALLENGADPSLIDHPGAAGPLFMAADSLDPVMVNLLLDAGADPRIEGPGGRTALTQAVSGGALWDLTDRPLLGGCRAATVRALLAHDPTLRVPDTPAGHNAIGWARAHDCAEVLKLIDVNPNKPGQKAVAAVGIIRETLGIPRPRDVLRGRRATGAQSPP